MLKKKGILGTFYGSFFKWEPQKHTELVKKFGWKTKYSLEEALRKTYEKKFIDPNT